jgi:hypothetical protein
MTVEQLEQFLEEHRSEIDNLRTGEIWGMVNWVIALSPERQQCLGNEVLEWLKDHTPEQVVVMIERLGPVVRRWGVLELARHIAEKDAPSVTDIAALEKQLATALGRKKLRIGRPKKDNDNVRHQHDLYKRGARTWRDHRAYLEKDGPLNATDAKAKYRNTLKKQFDVLTTDEALKCSYAKQCLLVWRRLGKPTENIRGQYPGIPNAFSKEDFDYLMDKVRRLDVWQRKNGAETRAETETIKVQARRVRGFLPTVSEPAS